MQKYRWLVFLFILGILILGGCLFFFYGIFSNGPPIQIPQLPAFIRTAQVEVLIIDMNANDNPSIYDSFNRDDALLALHTAPSNNHQNDKINSQLLLSDININKNGRLNPDDALFKNLELATFNGAPGQVQFTPIYQAGIRVIYLDLTNSEGKRISPSALMLPKPVGTVILSDGSARLIREMWIDESYLKRVFNQ